MSSSDIVHGPDTHYAKFYYSLMKSDLPPTAQAVLCALLDLKRKGSENPKIERLQRITGRRRRSVEDALRRLRDLNLIEIIWGQRQSRYRIAPPEQWPELLAARNPDTQKSAYQNNPDTQKTAQRVTQKTAYQKPPHPITVREPFFERRDLEKEGSREKALKASTRANAPQKAVPPPVPVLNVVPAPTAPLDFLEMLSEVREIYRRAGVPVPPKHEQLALQLLLSLDPAAQSRAPTRLPNYLKWALATGRWDSPATTKSLLNVLRDGDWDVELTVRDLPDPRRKPSIGELRAQEYLRRHAKGNA